MDVPSTLYGLVFTTRQREALDRLANFIEDWILITPEAGAIASAVAGHAALTSGVHGISAFGATLIDDASASAARTTLGLGTMATQNLATLATTRFEEGELLEFVPRPTVARIDTAPAIAGGTCVNLIPEINNNNLWGFDDDYSQFGTFETYTWFHKDGTTWTPAIQWAGAPVLGGAIFNYFGQVSGCQDGGATERLLGYMDVPLNTQNATYTYALTDRGFGVGKNNTTAYTHTVPPNASVAFPIGTVIAYFNDGSAGDLTIAQGAGVTIVLDGTTTTGNRTVAPGGTGRLWKVDTNRWICGGSATT